MVAGNTALAAGTGDLNVEFLERNQQQPGVVTLPSGLQYKIVAAGPSEGKSPGLHDACTCHYEGSLALAAEGAFFDSSRARGRPATFAPSKVIAGWTEALQRMKPGDRWILYIPAALGYGTRGSGRTIPGGSTLIFDLELLSVSDSTGPFAGTFLDTPVIGSYFKVWHAILVMGLLHLYGKAGKGGGTGKVTASHILVPKEQLALLEEIKTKLVPASTQNDNNNNTASSTTTTTEALFSAFAKEHSTCPSGKRNGGSLGTFGPGRMVPAFDTVCWAAPVGVVQGPVQTKFGYHLILVTERNDDAEKKD